MLTKLQNRSQILGQVIATKVGAAEEAPECRKKVDGETPMRLSGLLKAPATEFERTHECKLGALRLTRKRARLQFQEPQPKADLSGGAKPVCGPRTDLREATAIKSALKKT